MGKYYLISILALAIGCQPPTRDIPNINEHKYLTVFRKGLQTDTITKRLVSQNFVDSVYNLTYTKELDTQRYKLPISNISQPIGELNFKLIDEKSVYYEGDKPNDYIVYKFLFDDPNAADEEMLLFFSPEFGILIEKSAWWGNYGKLIETGNPTDKDELFFLSEMIMFDSEFFHNWTYADKSR